MKSTVEVDSVSYDIWVAPMWLGHMQRCVLLRNRNFDLVREPHLCSIFALLGCYAS